MNEKTYNIEFNNYMKKAANNITHSNNVQIAAISDIYNQLSSHLKKAPLKYESFAEYISNYPPNPYMYYTIQNRLIGLRNSTIIFPGPQEFFTHVLSNPSNVLDFYIDYNDAYISRLYNLS